MKKKMIRLLSISMALVLLTSSVDLSVIAKAADEDMKTQISVSANTDEDDSEYVDNDSDEEEINVNDEDVTSLDAGVVHKLTGPVIDGDVVDWDCVYFGKLRQGTDSTEKTWIKWRVLSVNGNDAYLISDECLRRSKFNSKKEEVNWIDSSIRERLNIKGTTNADGTVNSSFYDDIFDEKEKTAIIPMELSEGITDYVALPSYKDITNEKYGFINDDSRKAGATEYLLSSNASLVPEDGNVKYWLRRNTASNSYDNMRIVDTKGAAGSTVVADVDDKSVAARVVLHLDTKSDSWLYAGVVSTDETRNHEINYAMVTLDYNIEELDEFRYVTKYMDVTGSYVGLAEPSRPDYNFGGWYYFDGNEDIQVTAEDKLKTTKDHTLIAKWNKIYNIKLYSLGGYYSYYNITRDSESVYGDLPTPKWSGHIFKGWYYDDGENEIAINSDDKLVVLADHQLYAKWEEGVRIKLDPKCNEYEIAYIERQLDDNYGDLPVLEREGYVFIGWGKSTYSSYLREAVKPEDTVGTSDSTLYAIWRKIVNIELDCKGGSCSVSSITRLSREPYGELPVPTREGFVFNGWYLASDGYMTLVSEYDKVSGSSDYTLRATWSYALRDDISNPLAIKNEYGYVDSSFDIVYLGQYIQNDTNDDRIIDEDDEPVYLKWIVADISGDDVTLISYDNIDVRKYNNTDKDYSWKNSDLRNWLNSYDDHKGKGFYDIAFSDEEKVALLQNEDDDFVSLIKDVDMMGYMYKGEFSFPVGCSSLVYKKLDNSCIYNFWVRSNKTDAAYAWQERWYDGVYPVEDMSHQTGVRPVIHVKKSSGIWKNGVRDYTGSNSEGSCYLLFDANGGAVDVKEKCIPFGYVVGELPVPIRKGYLFDGWYTQREGGKKIEESTIASDYYISGQSMKLYARWLRNPNHQLNNPYEDEYGNIIYDRISFGHYFQYSVGDIYYWDSFINDYDGRKPIEWRVLKVDGDDAFLVADDSVEFQPYAESEDNAIWKDNCIRSFLNGYGSDENSEGIDYSQDNFYDVAFNEFEKEAINKSKVIVKNGDTDVITEDNVVLLKYSDVVNAEYGFSEEPSKSDTRREVSATNFAEKKVPDISSSQSYNSWWIINDEMEQQGLSLVSEYGQIKNEIAKNYPIFIRPAIHIKLSSDQWKYAGTVRDTYSNKNAVHITLDTDGGECAYYSKYGYRYDMIGELPTPAKKGYIFKGWYLDKEHTIPVSADTVLSEFKNYTIYASFVNEKASKLYNPRKDEGITTWDTIYFGHYLQSDTNNDGVINAQDQLEPIKWRVLGINNDKAMLISDKIIDYRAYDSIIDDGKVTWENSELRRWLNGYEEFSAGKGNSFIDMAFTEAEKACIYDTTVKDNGHFMDKYYPKNDGCVNKVYLLNLTESCDPRYGFVATTNFADVARKAVLTDYAGSLMGNNVTYDAYGSWGLRNVIQGDTDSYAMQVDEFGTPYTNGYNSYLVKEKNGIRPVINIDIAQANWLYAGNVSSDGAGLNIKDVLVTFDADGGLINSFDTKYVSVGYSYGYLPVPIKADHMFSGWYTEAGELITEASIVSISEDHKLVARWKLLDEVDKIVKVNFDGNGGVVSAISKNVLYNDVYGILPVAEKPGYELIGWYTKADGGELITSDTIVKNMEEHSLYARWKEIEKVIVNVTFDGNGGSCNTVSMNAILSSKYGQLPIANKDKYVFVGWYTTADGGTLVDENTIVTNEKPHTLYAHFTNITLAKKQKYDVSVYFKDVQNIKKYKVIKIDGGKASVTKKGILKAGKEGTVSIVPYIKNGKKLVPASVEPLVIKITKPVIAKSIKSEKIGETINASTYLTDVPSNSNKVVWSVPNEKVCKIDAETGVITVLNKGKVKITALITNDQGNVAKLSTTLTVKIKK